jgi:hypothetical protein
MITPLLSPDEVAGTVDAIDAMIRRIAVSDRAGELVGMLHVLRCGCGCGRELRRPSDPRGAELFDALCTWWAAHDHDPIATD